MAMRRLGGGEGEGGACPQNPSDLPQNGHGDGENGGGGGGTPGRGGGGRRAGSPRHKSADALLSLIGLPRRGSLLGSGKGQPLPSCTPDVGSRLRLIFRLDYLAYLMIFASLLSSIVFTRTAGY